MLELGLSLRRFWLGMADHLWQSSLVLLLLFLLAWALRNAPSRLGAAPAWLGVLKLALPLPILGPVAAAWFAGLFPGLGGGASAASAMPRFATTVLVHPAGGLPEGALTQGAWAAFWIAVTVLWIAGALGILLFSARRYARWSRTRADAAPLPAEGRNRLMAAARAASVDPGNVQVVTRPIVPVVVGLLRPRILLSASLLRALDRRELAAVLRHEEEHRRRRDPLRACFLELARAPFFFYPPVWLLVRRIHRATESACDEAVVRAGFAPELYGRSLARTLRLGAGPEGYATAASGVRPSAFRRRMERLADLERRFPMLRHRLAIALAATAVVAASFLPVVPSRPIRVETTAPLPNFERLEGSNELVRVNFHDMTPLAILESLGRSGSFQVKITGPLFPHPVTLVQNGWIPIRDVLAELGKRYALNYQVPDPHTLLVSAPLPRMPGKGPLIAGLDGVTVPELIPESRVQAVYPEELRAAGITGSAILQAVITETGDVTDVEVLRVTPKEYTAFGDAAVEAARQWKYKPATKDGKAVPVYLTIKVDFVLDNEDQ